MNVPPNSDSWIETLMFTALAAFAGLMGYLMRNANDKRLVTWERSVLETLASGFIGFLTVMMCRAMHIPYEWTGFIAGVLGWLGATASMTLFESIIRKKLGIDNVDLGDFKTDTKSNTTNTITDTDVRDTDWDSDVVRGTPTQQDKNLD